MRPADPYKVQLVGRGLRYEIRVNDWIVGGNGGTPHRTFTFLTNIQVDGENTLQLFSERGANPSEWLAAAELRVSVASDSRTVFEYAWRGGDSDPPMQPDLSALFVSPTEYGEWSWLRAEPVDLSNPVVTAVSELVEQIHGALDRRAIDEVAMLFEVRDRERAISLGDPPDEEAAAARADYAGSFEDPEWKMQPLDRGAFRFRLMADRRVVQVTDPAGRDVLMSLPAGEGGQIGFSVYAAKVAGRWTIVH